MAKDETNTNSPYPIISKLNKFKITSIMKIKYSLK